MQGHAHSHCIQVTVGRNEHRTADMLAFSFRGDIVSSCCPPEEADFIYNTFVPRNTNKAGGPHKKKTHSPYVTQRFYHFFGHFFSGEATEGRGGRQRVLR